MKVLKNYNKYGKSHMSSGQIYLDMIPTIKHTEDKDDSIRTTYKIPVGGLKPCEAKKKLREIIENYKMESEVDYWFPVKTNDVDNTMEVDYFGDVNIKNSMIIDGEVRNRNF